jgi:hypothetical protein
MILNLVIIRPKAPTILKRPYEKPIIKPHILDLYASKIPAEPTPKPPIKINVEITRASF